MRCTGVTPGLLSTAQTTGEWLLCYELQIVINHLWPGEFCTQRWLHSFFLSPHSCVSLLGCCHLQSWFGTTPLQWVLHTGRPKWCDAAAPVWVPGRDVSFVQRCNTYCRWDEKLKLPLLFLLQICSLCCPAPLNHQDMCFWLQGDCDLLISFSLSFSKTSTYYLFVFSLQGILQTSANFWQQHPVFAELPFAHVGYFSRIWWVWVTCANGC